MISQGIWEIIKISFVVVFNHVEVLMFNIFSELTCDKGLCFANLGLNIPNLVNCIPSTMSLMYSMNSCK